MEAPRSKRLSSCEYTFNIYSCIELQHLLAHHCYPILTKLCCRFQPGPTFARSWATSALPCLELDPATHEIWLLQLPLDVRLSPLCPAMTSLHVSSGHAPPT